MSKNKVNYGLLYSLLYIIECTMYSALQYDSETTYKCSYMCNKSLIFNYICLNMSIFVYMFKYVLYMFKYVSSSWCPADWITWSMASSSRTPLLPPTAPSFFELFVSSSLNVDNNLPLRLLLRLHLAVKKRCHCLFSLHLAISVVIN